MKTLISVLLLLLLLPVVLRASQREVKLQVLSSRQRALEIGVGGGTPCSEPFPADATAIETLGAGSVSQCTFTPSVGGVLSSAQVTYVKATLTTADGSSYYVYLSCQKQYGTCVPLKDNETYLAKLSEGAEQLADYVHRRVVTPVNITLRPDGKRKVSYMIVFATKASPQP